MANLQQKKSDALATIDSALAIINKFPAMDETNSQLSFNTSSNPFPFLMDAFKSTAGYNILIQILSKFLLIGLPPMEIAIKAVLLANIKNLLSCSINPFISDEILRDGIVFNLEQIDITDTLKYCPTSKNGQYYYFDIKYEADYSDGTSSSPDVDDMGGVFKLPDDLKYSKDFNCLLWYMKNRASFREVWGKKVTDNTSFETDSDYWNEDKKKCRKGAGIVTLEFNERSQSLKNAEGNGMSIQTPYNNCLHVFIGNTKESDTIKGTTYKVMHKNSVQIGTNFYEIQNGYITYKNQQIEVKDDDNVISITDNVTYFLTGRVIIEGNKIEIAYRQSTVEFNNKIYNVRGKKLVAESNRYPVESITYTIKIGKDIIDVTDKNTFEYEKKTYTIVDNKVNIEGKEYEVEKIGYINFNGDTLTVTNDIVTIDEKKYSIGNNELVIPSNEGYPITYYIKIGEKDYEMNDNNQIEYGEDSGNFYTVDSDYRVTIDAKDIQGVVYRDGVIEYNGKTYAVNGNTVNIDGEEHKVSNDFIEIRGGSVSGLDSQIREQSSIVQTQKSEVEKVVKNIEKLKKTDSNNLKLYKKGKISEEQYKNVYFGKQISESIDLIKKLQENSIKYEDYESQMDKKSSDGYYFKDEIRQNLLNALVKQKFCDEALLKRTQLVKEQHNVSLDYRPIEQNYYYRHTLIEFNTDYVMSLRLFDSKVITAQLIDSLTSLLTIDLDLSWKQQLIKNEVQKMVKMIVETDDTVVDDCFFTFTNESYDAMLEKAELNRMKLFSIDGEQNTPTPIDVDEILDNLNSLDDEAIQSGNTYVIEHALTEISKTVSQSDPEVKDNVNFGVQMNFIENLMNNLAYVITSAVLSPKVYLLILINLQLLGKDTNFDLQEFIGKYKQLIASILRSIRDQLMKYLVDELMKLLSNIAVDVAVKIGIEQMQYYNTLIRKILDCWKRNKDTMYDFNIDSVNYADIVSEEVTEKKREC